MDARRSVRSHRASLSESETARRPRGDGHRMAVDADSEVSEPGVQRANAPYSIVRALDKEGKGVPRRAANRSRGGASGIPSPPREVVTRRNETSRDKPMSLLRNDLE